MKTSKKLFLLLAAGLFAAMLHSCENRPLKVHYTPDNGKFSIPFGESYNYTDILVKRVVDGDTLVLESGERVRMIGIDT
ncbi:MAG: hypothetical protein Q8N85_01935, partial [Candidatus Omnitrophota bacterium]|nr:hypothetical protein [Candidatus Omnitrophota bacterium]